MAEHPDAGTSTQLAVQLDRRRFLQMAAVLGAAAGTGDVFLARPEQASTTGQVPPDPTELDAGAQVIMSVCQNCHSRCGIMARVKDGVVLKIGGNPDHPSNLGPDERPPYATPNELMTWDEKANRGRKNHFKPDILEAKYILLFGSSFLKERRRSPRGSCASTECGSRGATRRPPPELVYTPRDKTSPRSVSSGPGMCSTPARAAAVGSRIVSIRMAYLRR